MGGVVGPGGRGKVRRDVQERAKECYAEAECWVARKGRCSWGVDCVKQEIETSRAIGRRRLHSSAVEEWMVGVWQVDAGQEMPGKRHGYASFSYGSSCLSEPATDFLRDLEFLANSAVKICQKESGKEGSVGECACQMS
jgi:hypothetical protein